MDVAHGALDLRVPQALLHVADVPVGADQLRRMRVPQHMCMEWKVVLAAVMSEHCFDCLVVQRATISNPAALVSCGRLEDYKEVVSIVVVLQDELIQKSHQAGREIDKPLLAFTHGLRQGLVVQVATATHPHSIAMKLDVLQPKSQHFPNAQSALTHQQQDTSELKVLR